MRFLFLLFLVLFVGCTAPEEPMMEVAVPAGGGAAEPRFAAAADGNLYLCWTEPDGEGHRFRISKLEAGVWGEPRTVASGNNWFVNWADYPSLAVLKDGTLACHWLAMSAEGTYTYDVWVSVSGDGGDTSGDSSVQTAFTGTPAELETGVTLDVKVNIGNNGQTILLGLLPEISELSRWRSFNVVAGSSNSNNNNNNNGDSNADTAPGTVELPETTKASIKTAVCIKSGEMVALGGLATLPRKRRTP